MLIIRIAMIILWYKRYIYVQRIRHESLPLMKIYAFSLKEDHLSVYPAKLFSNFSYFLSSARLFIILYYFTYIYIFINLCIHIFIYLKRDRAYSQIYLTDRQTKSLFWWRHEKPFFKTLINTRIGSIQRDLPIYPKT